MRTKLLVFMMIMMCISVNFHRADAQTAWVCPEGFEGHTLKIYSWPAYVAETTISNFEEACGVTIEFSAYSSIDQLRIVLELQDTPYDVAIGSVTEIASLAEQGLIQPLDHAQIPQLDTMTLIVQSMPGDPFFIYGAPYQWGTIGILYDSSVLETPMTSWDEFFAYEGRVAWVDDSQMFLRIALTKLGFPFSSADEAEIQAAADYLLEVPQNDVFAITDMLQSDLLLNGEVDAIVTTNVAALSVMNECECDDYVYVLPSEGLLTYGDAMMIPANAENPALAHAFIDYILDPQVNADLSSAVGSASPILASLPLVDEAVLNNGISYIPAEDVQAFINNLLVIEDVGQGLEFYVEAWTRIKSELAGR